MDATVKDSCTMFYWPIERFFEFNLIYSLVPTAGKVLEYSFSACVRDDQVVESHHTRLGPKALRGLVAYVYADLLHHLDGVL